MMKTDSQLQQDVLNELKWEPAVEHEKIGISVDDGVVTLSGLVPSYSISNRRPAIPKLPKGSPTSSSGAAPSPTTRSM